MPGAGQRAMGTTVSETVKEPGESQNQSWFKLLMDEHFYQKGT